MTSPLTVSCTEDVWTKVATAVQSGWLHLQGASQDPIVAYYAFLDTGEAAPTLMPNASGSKAVLMCQHEPINNDVKIDIYVHPTQENVTVLVAAK